MSRYTLLTVGGVPLRISPLFVVVAIVIGWRAGQAVADVRFATVPGMPADWRELATWLQTHDPMDFTTTRPSTGWVIAAALAAIVAAGPLVTALLALGAYIALLTLG